MQLAGTHQAAQQLADELFSIWSHLDEVDQIEQMDAHMEAEGFTSSEIETELSRLGFYQRIYQPAFLPSL